MTDKRFHAILAKNDLARQLRDCEKGIPIGTTSVCTAVVVACLEDIESYIGEGNQPSVKDILNSEVI